MKVCVFTTLYSLIIHRLAILQYLRNNVAKKVMCRITVSLALMLYYEEGRRLICFSELYDGYASS